MDKYTKLALQVFWFRRYEIHSLSPPQVEKKKKTKKKQNRVSASEYANKA